MTSPIISCLVEISTAFQDEIVTPSGLRFFLDGSYNKNYTATVVGKIAALPIKAQSEKDAKILANLAIGDEVCISYMVVFDVEYESDGFQFMEVTEGSEMMRSWISGAGEKLDVVALPGKIKPHWVGYYRNKFNQHVDGCEGDQSTVERWLSQFSMGKTDKYHHRNKFNFNGKDYWKADLQDIFAKRVNGEIVSVSNRVICEPVEEDMPLDIKYNIAQIGTDVKIRYQDRGLVISGGENKGINKGDIVAFPPNVLEKYEFFGKEYYLINESFVHGKFCKQ